MPVFADASVVGDGDAYHCCGEEGEDFHDLLDNSLTCEILSIVEKEKVDMCGTLRENL